MGLFFVDVARGLAYLYLLVQLYAIYDRSARGPGTGTGTAVCGQASAVVYVVRSTERSTELTVLPGSLYHSTMV